MSFVVFGIPIHWYGVMVAFGVLAGFHLAVRRTKRYGLKSDIIERLLPWLLLGGIVGGRLYHVVHYIRYYEEDPVRIFMVWQGGLGIFGALFGGGIALWFGCVYYRVSQGKLLDLLAPSLALGQAIGRIGNYFNAEGFGPPTTFPWGIAIAKNQRPPEFYETRYFHPTFLYESLWLAGGTLLMLKLEKNGVSRGVLFGCYLIWFGLGRFFLEFLRLDTAMVGTLKVAHVLALFCVIWGSLYIVEKTA